LFGGTVHLTPWHGLHATEAFCGNACVALNLKSTALSSVSSLGEQPPSLRS
jgi:hypothetical protein